MAEAVDEKSNEEPFWRNVAQRFSGRGRIRSVFFLAALIFSSWNPICAGIGLFVFVIGMVLHAVSKGNLVRNKQLCTGGPYAWVRHPFYAANFVIDLSLCLMAGAPIVAAVYALLFPLAYLPRIFAEEEMLRTHFGVAFDDYCRATPRLFPRSIPRLIAWSRSSAYENMRLENELSRLIRLAAYPFFIAAGILLKRWWVEHEAHWTLLAACAAMALALWAAGQLLHWRVEDGKAMKFPGVARALIFGWFLAPLLPLLQQQLAILQLPEADAQVRLAGKIILPIAALAILLPGLRPSWREGLGWTLLAFGCALTTGQAVLAPLLALLVWSGWFLRTQSPPDEPAGATSCGAYPRLAPGLAAAAFVVCLVCVGKY